MKPQRFSPGEEVVRTGKTITKVNDKGYTPPKLNEIVKVLSYDRYWHCFKNWVIVIEGYPNQLFGENLFEPIMSQSVLEEELNSISNVETH